jgi:hypothetical protein
MQYRSRLVPLSRTRTFGKSTPSIIATTQSTLLTGQKHAFVDTLEPWEIDVLRMNTMHADPNAVCEALSHGFRAASDGSVCVTTQGAFGWTLSTTQGIQVATGRYWSCPRPNNIIIPSGSVRAFIDSEVPHPDRGVHGKVRTLNRCSCYG